MGQRLLKINNLTLQPGFEEEASFGAEASLFIVAIFPGWLRSAQDGSVGSIQVWTSTSTTMIKIEEEYTEGAQQTQERAAPSRLCMLHDNTLLEVSLNSTKSGRQGLSDSVTQCVSVHFIICC